MGYILAADDCGVMRFSAITLQNANDALAKRPQRVVEKALQRLVDIGLLLDFTHQGRRYVLQRDWQEWQAVTYPRESVNPDPPAETLARCCVKTQELFAERLRLIAKRSEKKTEKFSERLPLARTAMATANGNGSGNGSTVALTEIQERAGTLLQELYPAWYTRHRHGAKLRLIANSLALDDAISVVTLWDDARIEKLAQIFLTTDEKWIAETDRSFRLFASKASWCDSRLAEAEQAGV